MHRAKEVQRGQELGRDQVVLKRKKAEGKSAEGRDNPPLIKELFSSTRISRGGMGRKGKGVQSGPNQAKKEGSKKKTRSMAQVRMGRSLGKSNP